MPLYHPLLHRCLSCHRLHDPPASSSPTPFCGTTSRLVPAPAPPAGPPQSSPDPLSLLPLTHSALCQPAALAPQRRGWEKGTDKGGGSEIFGAPMYQQWVHASDNSPFWPSYSTQAPSGQMTVDPFFGEVGAGYVWGHRRGAPPTPIQTQTPPHHHARLCTTIAIHT